MKLMDTDQQSLLNAAESYIARGFALTWFDYGRKFPRHEGWNTPEKVITTLEQARVTWGNGRKLNIGLVHGLGAVKTCSFDVDQAELTRAVLAEFGIDLDALRSGVPSIQGNPANFRLEYRQPADADLPLVKLVWPSRENPKEKITVFELRAGANQDVLPPSLHPSGKMYEWIHPLPDDPADHPQPPPVLLELWTNWEAWEPALQATCPWAKAPKPKAKPHRKADGARPDVIGAFNQTHDVKALLEAHHYKPRGKNRYLPPNSTSGVPSVRILDSGKVFSDNGSCPLNEGHAHDAFSCYCILEHAGDVRAAVKAAAKLLGMELPPREESKTVGADHKIGESVRPQDDDPNRSTETGTAEEADLVAGAEAILHAALARFKNGDKGAPVELAALDAWRALKAGNFARYVARKAECKGILKYLDEALGEPSAPDPKRPTRTSASLRAQYAVIDGSLHLLKESPFGPVPVLLGDFDARITRAVTYDDGASERNLFVIEGRRASGQPLPTVQVPTAQFATLNWINMHWGHGVTVAAGQSLKDHARAGIQILSRERGDIPRQIIFGHLGWRRLEDRWYFLHGGGAIGEAGQRAGVEVDIGPGHLQHYRLPGPPAPKSGEIIAAIRASLALATLATDQAIGWSLLAAVYRVPLSEALPVDVSVFLHGPTGAKKSELTALALAHFGEFDSRSFPANWQDSANRLEKISHHAKDALLVVDDFKPQGDSRANAKLHDAAERLLHHAAGNRSGRGRMRADLSEAPSYYPRGVILCSGEDLPGASSPSLRARLWVLRLEPAAVNLSALSAAQRQRSILAQAMSGYLAWLAPQLDDLKRDTAREFEGLRDRLTAGACPAHPRTPANHAHLRIGMESFLAYAQDAGALTPDQREQWSADATAALVAAAGQQAAYLQDADEVGRFLSLLQAVLTGDMGHLCEKESNGLPAEHASLWGWRRVTCYNPETRVNEDTREPRGPCIGWVDRQHVYLEPELTYGQVCALAQRQGRPFAVSAQSLWARLKDRGLLALWNIAGQRHTHRTTINGQRRTVIVLHGHSVAATEEMPS